MLIAPWFQQIFRRGKGGFETVDTAMARTIGRRARWVRCGMTAFAAGVLLLPACGRGGGGAEGPPEEAIVANARGAADLGQQEVEKAIVEFEAAVAKRPDDPVLLANLALSKMQQGKFDEAEKHLRAALAARTDFAAAHFRLGLVLKGRGAMDEAISEFQAVAAADPQDVPALYNLASLKARKGDLDGAIADFNRALALDPTHVSVLYGMGRALLQKGETHRGEEFLARSQKVRDELGIGETVGLQYGEQGKYSLASDYPAGDLSAPAAIAVTFEPAGQGAEGAAAWTLGDFNGDGRADLVTSAADGVSVRLGNGTGRFDSPQGAGPAGPATLLLPGDVTGDGTLDLLAAGPGGPVVLFRGTGGGKLEKQDGSGLPVGPKSAVLLSDVDHDGDLDAVLASSAPSGTRVEFFINAEGSGGQRFRLRNTLELPPAPAVVQLVATDFDNDLDVDLVALVPGATPPLLVLSNKRDGSYDILGSGLGLPADLGTPSTLAVADLNKDGFPDLLLANGLGVRLLLNESGRGVREDAVFRAAIAGAPGGGGAFALPFDFDNDGFLDAAALGGEAGSPRLSLVRNLGAGRWEDTTKATGLAGLPPGSLPSAGAAQLAAADLDGDGDLDLIARGAVLRNAGGEKAHWVSVSPHGVRDDRLGAGVKVEFRSGALWQKFEVGPEGLPVHMGLGPRDRLDDVRLIWPGGVLQDEVDVAAGGRREIAQLDRKGTSCPILYAWDGAAMRFVTDFLGGSAFGYLEESAPAPRWSVPDTDEYVRIRGDRLAAKDGRWELRMVNQLEEVILYDRAQLLVVDHPAGVDVFPDERLMPAPPFPGYRLFTVANARPPVWARDGEGRDVTAAVASEDRVTADGFGVLPWKGYAVEHDLIFGVADGAAGGPGRSAASGSSGAGGSHGSGGEQFVLLLDGWIDYADSTSNLAAGQAGATLMPPRLDAHRPGEAWRTVLSSMGFPAGLPKTMTVNLTGRLAPGETELRIRTSMRIYWDRVRIATGGVGTPVAVTRLEPAAADLHFLGYPAEVSPDGRKPMLYDYDRILPVARWKAHSGAYTRFGDVRPLLAAVDDRMVTTRHGDEIALSFDASAAPPLPAGWRRDFLLFVDGFGKDMDPNSARPDSVGPLPFHAMPVYPYAAGGYTPSRDWLDEWNTRLVLPDNAGTGGAAPPVARRAGSGLPPR